VRRILTRSDRMAQAVRAPRRHARGVTHPAGSRGACAPPPPLGGVPPTRFTSWNASTASPTERFEPRTNRADRLSGGDRRPYGAALALLTGESDCTRPRPPTHCSRSPSASWNAPLLETRDRGRHRVGLRRRRSIRLTTLRLLTRARAAATVAARGIRRRRP